MPGMPHLLLAVQPASAAGHRTCPPQAPAEAQAHYLRRFEILSEAAGYRRHDQAFDTE